MRFTSLVCLQSAFNACFVPGWPVALAAVALTAPSGPPLASFAQPELVLPTILVATTTAALETLSAIRASCVPLARVALRARDALLVTGMPTALAALALTVCNGPPLASFAQPKLFFPTILFATTTAALQTAVAIRARRVPLARVAILALDALLVTGMTTAREAALALAARRPVLASFSGSKGFRPALFPP